MVASELNRSAPRIHASGSYRLATVKRSAKESEPEESTEDVGANPTMTSESRPTVMGRGRTSVLPLPRPVVDQAVE